MLKFIRKLGIWKWLALILPIVWWSNDISLRRLNDQREEYGLTRMPPLENAPPALAFTTVALGGFRGLISNYLWMRSNKLQLEGRYFEALTLSDWITKLQPTLAVVWAHQSWNLVYNISRQFNTPEEKWEWVYSGIRLLRDDGLRFHPTDPMMYQELAWFFQDKMGRTYDEGHRYYKEIWAAQMAQIIGRNQPDYEALMHPVTPEDKERRRLLVEELKMKPERMRSLTEKYGPLDWRLPEAHAIYWADLGLDRCAGKSEKDLINLRQSIWQSMNLAFQRGRLIANSKNLTIDYGPNLEIADYVNEVFKEAIAQEPDKENFIRIAQKSFLKDAIYFFYTYGRMQEARAWYDFFREQFAEDPDAKLAMDQLALKQVSDKIVSGTMDKNRLIIEGLIVNAFKSMVMGEPDRAEGYLAMAEKAWAGFTQKVVNTKSDNRLSLPSVDVILQDVLKQVLDGGHGFTPQMIAYLKSELGILSKKPSE